MVRIDDMPRNRVIKKTKLKDSLEDGTVSMDANDLLSHPALEHANEIEVAASVDRLADVQNFIESSLEEAGAPQAIIYTLLIAVEELFVNVAHYAYPHLPKDKAGMAKVACVCHDDPGWTIIRIIDEGIPFDPLAKPDAELPQDIESAKIGGLGIFMVKSSVDTIAYQRKDGANVIIVEKNW